MLFEPRSEGEKISINIEDSFNEYHIETCQGWIEKSFRRKKISLLAYEVLMEMSYQKLRKIERGECKKRVILPHVREREEKLRLEGEHRKKEASHIQLVKRSSEKE